MMQRPALLPAAMAIALLALCQTAAWAEPVAITTPFINLESCKAHSLGRPGRAA